MKTNLFLRSRSLATVLSSEYNNTLGLGDSAGFTTSATNGDGSKQE